MPAFPERESSILALLKRKKPGRVPDTVEAKDEKVSSASPINVSQVCLLNRLLFAIFLRVLFVVNRIFKIKTKIQSGN